MFVVAKWLLGIHTCPPRIWEAMYGHINMPNALTRLSWEVSRDLHQYGSETEVHHTWQIPLSAYLQFQFRHNCLFNYSVKLGTECLVSGLLRNQVHPSLSELNNGEILAIQSNHLGDSSINQSLMRIKSWSLLICPVPRCRHFLISHVLNLLWTVP